MPEELTNAKEFRYHTIADIKNSINHFMFSFFSAYLFSQFPAVQVHSFVDDTNLNIVKRIILLGNIP